MRAAVWCGLVAGLAEGVIDLTMAHYHVPAILSVSALTYPFLFVAVGALVWLLTAWLHCTAHRAAVFAVRDRITSPLYIESYRIAPFKPRCIDVNVILDVMIHDIDLILSLVNAPVESVDAVGAPILSASEDIANARVRFANGCVATITASRVSTKAERKMRIFEPDSYIGIDFLNRTVTIVRKGKAVPGAELPEIIAATQSYEEVDALEYEISAFVDSVRTGAPPLVTGEDGLKALEAAITITDSLRRNRERLLSDMAAGASRAQRR